MGTTTTTRLLFAAATLFTLPMIDTPAAQARDYPFCLMGRDFAGVGDCKYDSYAQCMAAASGREAYCGANPFPGYFDATPAAAQPQSKRRAAR